MLHQKQLKALQLNPYNYVYSKPILSLGISILVIDRMQICRLLGRLAFVL